MAIAIKSVPTLTDEVAARFNTMAEENFTTKAASIDFSKEKEIAVKILAKSKGE